MSKHPFIRETMVDRSSIGRPPRIDRDFMMFEFASALASELGATLENEGEARSIYGVATIDVGDDLYIRISPMHGAKIGRVEVGAGSALSRKLDSHEWLKFPSATYDAARPIPTLAAAICKNIIGASRPLVETLRERVCRRECEADAFGVLIREMQAAMPALSINRRGERDLSADVYLNNSRGYITGTLGTDGRINFQRVSLNSADDCRALLALMTRES